MRTIAVLNQKGGVGKTTTVVNTAAALSAAGAKVVVIDLDPQAHLTIHLGLEPQKADVGSYKILTQSTSFESEIMLVRSNLWLLPANINLVGAESELVSVVGREIILKEAIEPSHSMFDYCLIDCAPSLGLLTLNALAAAQEVLIPLQPHFLALQGLGKLLKTVELVNKRINPVLKVTGILLCMFDSRASLPNEVKADITSFLENARGTDSAWSQAEVLPTFIRRNIKLAEAPSYGKTIFEYEPNCNGAEDYKQVAEYLHSHFNPTAKALMFGSSEEGYSEPEAEAVEEYIQPANNFTVEEQVEPDNELTEEQQDRPEVIQPDQMQNFSDNDEDQKDNQPQSPPVEIQEIKPPVADKFQDYTRYTTEFNETEP